MLYTPIPSSPSIQAITPQTLSAFSRSKGKRKIKGSKRHATPRSLCQRFLPPCQKKKMGPSNSQATSEQTPSHRLRIVPVRLRSRKDVQEDQPTSPHPTLHLPLIPCIHCPYKISARNPCCSIPFSTYPGSFFSSRTTPAPLSLSTPLSPTTKALCRLR